MPKGSLLSDTEKGQILAFKEEKRSNKWISRRISRSMTVIRYFSPNYLCKYQLDTFSTNLKPMEQRKVQVVQRNSVRERAGAFLELSNTQKEVRRVRDEIAPTVSHDTVWRVEKSSPNLVRQCLKTCPNLTEAHEMARIQFSENHITWTREWLTVHFCECV